MEERVYGDDAIGAFLIAGFNVSYSTFLSPDEGLWKPC